MYRIYTLVFTKFSNVYPCSCRCFEFRVLFLFMFWIYTLLLVQVSVWNSCSCVLVYVLNLYSSCISFRLKFCFWQRPLHKLLRVSLRVDFTIYVPLTMAIWYIHVKCIHTHMYICIYIYTYTYIHTYIYIYIFSQKHKKFSFLHLCCVLHTGWQISVHAVYVHINDLCACML